MSERGASSGPWWAVVAIGLAACVVVEGALAGAPVGEGTVDAIGTWWFQWWVADTLSTGSSFLYTDQLFFPFGKDVLAHTGANVLDALLVAPVRLALGPVAAWNLLVAAVVATNGLAAGLVARRGGALAGVLGAILGGLHPYVLHELGQGRPTQAIVAPLLGALVLGDTGLRRGGIGRLVAAGALLALQGWFYWFAGLFGALALAVLGAGAVWDARPRGVVSAGRLLVALGVAAALAAPVAGPLAVSAARGEASGLIDVSRWLADGTTVTREGDFVRLTVLGAAGEAGVLDRGGFLPDGPILGLGVLLLAALAPWRWRIVGLLALLFAFGPSIGGVTNPVYVAVAALCPPLARLWWPVRALSLLVPVAAVGLAALGRARRTDAPGQFAAALRRVPTAALGIGLAVVLGGEVVARGLLPFGTWQPRVPEGVAVLAESPKGAAIVLPWGYDQTPLLYQTTTGVPLFNGMYERTAAFVPDALRALQRENGFVSALMVVPVDPRAVTPYTEAEKAAFVALGYRWVVLRRAATGPPDGARARGVLRRLTQMLGAPRVQDADVYVWDLAG